jgi:hypothetical protein
MFRPPILAIFTEVFSKEFYSSIFIKYLLRTHMFRVFVDGVTTHTPPTVTQFNTNNFIDIFIF